MSQIASIEFRWVPRAMSDGTPWNGNWKLQWRQKMWSELLGMFCDTNWNDVPFVVPEEEK